MQGYGAIGVAVGTVVGAVVSLGVHVMVSMRYTRSTILIPRRQFRGCRPAAPASHGRAIAVTSPVLETASNAPGTARVTGGVAGCNHCDRMDDRAKCRRAARIQTRIAPAATLAPAAGLTAVQAGAAVFFAESDPRKHKCERASAAEVPNRGQLRKKPVAGRVSIRISYSRHLSDGHRRNPGNSKLLQMLTSRMIIEV